MHSLAGWSRGREEIMSQRFTVVIEQDGEAYLGGTVPELTGCRTQAE